MPIFLVHTIKELEHGTINTDFVIETENESMIKELMAHYKVIVVGINKVAGWPTSARFYGILGGQDMTLKFCLKSESIEEACSRCIDLELPILSINDIQQPLSETDSQNLIKHLIQKRNETIQQQQAIEQQKKKKKAEVMDDKRKDKIMNVITDTLQDISKIEKEFESNITVIEKTRKLHDLKEQLTKIKMGSNLEKATTVLEETFTVMEELELSNLNQLKEEEQKVSSTSVISNVDIMSELEKIKKANQATEAGTKKTSSDLYYTYLGITGLYQKFIVKDIIGRFKQFKSLMGSIVDYIDFSLICMNVFIGIILGYLLITNTSLNQHLFISMITLGVFGIVRELPLAVRKSSFFLIIVYIVLAIVISIIIQKMLIVNFALV